MKKKFLTAFVCVLFVCYMSYEVYQNHVAEYYISRPFLSCSLLTLFVLGGIVAYGFHRLPKRSQLRHWQFTLSELLLFTAAFALICALIRIVVLEFSR
jgi:hypothetical protein